MWISRYWCLSARLIAIALATLFAFNASAMDEDPRASAGFYTDSFGVVDSSTYPLAKRVGSVFSRLLKVADRTEYKDPGLLLIDSPDWPWAIALPDNNVVLTRGAVDLCYRDVSPEQGDARLALILGHELGHLAEDDYWHRDVYISLANHAEQGTDDVLRFIGERSGLVDTQSDKWKTIVRDRELKADDRGFVYAALAGFNTRLLVEREKKSFFHYWTEQTSAAPGDFHLSADDRAAYLRARSGALNEVAEMYRLGAALVHLGELSFAETVFRQVLTTFPAHEVYNNLGFIQLQRSLENISLDLDQVFWMPASFDTAPETPGLKTRNLGKAFAEHDPQAGLEEAARYFSLALKQDPGYLDGYLNLATARFYQQKFSGAAAVLAEARAIAEDPASGEAGRLNEIESLWQVAMLRSLQGSVDYLPIATAKLEAMVSGSQVAPVILFNLAQLYHMGGRPDLAQALWASLGRDDIGVPEPFGTVARYRLTGEMETVASQQHAALPASLLDSVPKTVSGSLAEPLPVTLNSARLVRIGAPLLLSAGVREYRLNDAPVLRISRLGQGVSAKRLDACCGSPVTLQETALGEVRSYGGSWAALVENGEISEIWERGDAIR